MRESTRRLWESLNDNNIHDISDKTRKRGNMTQYDTEDEGESIARERHAENVTYFDRDSMPPYETSETQAVTDARTETTGGAGGNIDDKSVWENISDFAKAYKGGVDAKQVSENILSDEENAEQTVSEEGSFNRLPGATMLDRFRESQVYAAYMYSPADWAEKARHIEDKTGISASALLSNKDLFAKADKLTQEIDRKEKLAGVTDANGHVNMDKLYEAIPILQDLHEAHDTASAVMVLNSAPSLLAINDVYQNEASRLFGSIATGLERGWGNLKYQATGIKAMPRALLENKGFTQEELSDLMRYAQELEKLPQYSYSSPGAALGGVLGSAAENIFLMAPEMLRGGLAAAGIGASGFTGGASAAAAFALMAAQIGGGNFVENLAAVDENGKPKYTPRQALALSVGAAIPNAAIEKWTIGQMGRAIFGRKAATELASLYAKREAALAEGQTLEALTREIIYNRFQEASKAGLLSGWAEMQEEGLQEISDDMARNIAEAVFRGGNADVKSMEEILDDSFTAMAEAAPSIVGFGLVGAGGSTVANTQAVLNARDRFKKAQSSALVRNVYENQYRNGVIDSVADNIEEAEELAGMDKDLRDKTLDSMNAKHGLEDSEVDIVGLMQMGGEDAVQEVAEAAGKSQEEVQACLDGTGMLSVKTSALQELMRGKKQEEREAFYQHVTGDGGVTVNQAQQYAKDVAAAIKTLQENENKEEEKVISNFVETSFDEQDRELAADVIAADTGNPAAEVKRRQRANQAAIDEILNPVRDSLNAGAGQGVEIIKTVDENGNERTFRLSNNAPWYRKFYADHGRAPTKQEFEDIVYENAIGTATDYANNSYDGTPEEQEYYAQVKSALDELYAQRDALERVGAVLRNVEKGELLTMAAMPEDARQAYNSIVHALKATGNRALSAGAKFQAVLAARIASRVAQARRESGKDKNATAMSVLPHILAGNFENMDDEAIAAQNGLSQFAGEKARGANADALQKAMGMVWMGKTPEEIYKETGWFKGEDGKWRFEIPDDVSKINYENVKKRGKSTLEKVYDNPALYEAYPFLKKVRVVATEYENEDYHGQTYGRTIEISKKDLEENEDEALYTLVHEIQHLIQDREGFASGGTAESAREILGDKLKKDKNLSKLTDDELYENLAGEQEARYTEDRADLRLQLDQALEDKADAEEALAEAIKNKDEQAEDNARKALFVATMQERQVRRKLEQMPTPHDENAIVVFGDTAVAKVTAQTPEVYLQEALGRFVPSMNLIQLFQNANQSTFMHEMAHFYLSELMALSEIAPEDSQAAKDLATIAEWAEWHEGMAEEYKGTKTYEYFKGLENAILEAEKNGSVTMEDGRTLDKDQLLNIWMQERFARGFEEYLRKGTAPTTTLRKAFRAFKDWLKKIYEGFVGVGAKPSAEVKAVMDRMIASDEEIETMAVLKRAEMIARVSPELLNTETAAMLERWEEEAEAEAKEKLLAELIKEQEEKDVEAHVEAFREAEMKRLQTVRAFMTEMLAKGTGDVEGIGDEAAAELMGYPSVEAYHKDLQEQGKSFEKALDSAVEAERERYIEEMPNAEYIHNLAEQALTSSDYAQRLTALEAEILRRRKNKFKSKASFLVSRAIEDIEKAFAGEPENLRQRILALRYSYRWNKNEQEHIDKMNQIIDDMELDEEARREKLQAEIKKLKEATLLNADWLRGVRDAAKGQVKAIREGVKAQMNEMPVKDSTNFRRFLNEAKKAAQECVKALTNAIRKNNGKEKKDTGEQNFEAAQQAKMRQTIAEIQAAEAIKMKADLDKIKKYFERVDKALSNDKRGEIDASTRYYLRHIMYILGFKKQDAPMPQTLVDFNVLFDSAKDTYDAKNEGNGRVGDLDVDFVVPAWLAALATGKEKLDYKELKMPELKDARTLVRILYTTARNKNRLLTMDRNVQDVVGEMAKDFNETVTVNKNDEGIHEAFALLLRPIVMLKTLGNTFVKYIYNPLLDGWEKQTQMYEAAAQDLNNLFARHWNKNTRRKMRKDKLKGVELPDGKQFTKEEILVLALNWGNEGNMKRALNGLSHDGYVATMADVEELFAKAMTAEDWAFIQECWDYINTFGDKVNEIVEKLTGAPMKRVEPRAFSVTLENGEKVDLRGGYYPIAYDTKKSIARGEQELMTSAQAIGATAFSGGMGSTKARSEEGLQESPLLLSMDVLFRHVEQQIHIATMRLPCRDVYKILQNRDVQYMIAHSIGVDAYRQLKRWVENVWIEPLQDGNWYTRILEAGRRNTVAAIMGARTGVAVLNTLPNFVLMVRELGALNALNAVCKFYAHPKRNRAWVLKESPFMANRANNIDRDIKQAQKNSFAPNPFTDMVNKTAGWLIAETDMMFSLATYQGVYERVLNDELQKGTKEEDANKAAHYAAEDVIRKIFGSADTIDQSAIQRSRELIVKSITPFYTYVSTQANVLFEEYMKSRYQGSKRTMLDTGEVKTEKKKFFERYGGMVHAFLYTMVLETLVEQLMRDGIDYLTGGDDDKKKQSFLKRWAVQSMTTFTGAIPGVNIAGEAVGNWILGKQYPTRAFGVTETTFERIKKGVQDIGKLAEGKGDYIEIGRDLTRAVAGTGYGFPDTYTDAIFNAAKAFRDHYSPQEWFINSLFDRKLKDKKKGK